MSNMNEFVTKMISDYENILKTVSLKLDEMKEFAKNNNINISSKETNVNSSASVPNNNTSTQNEFKINFEKQRQAMIEQINKMKEDAKRQTQQAIEEANKMRSQIPQMPNMTMPQMSNVSIPQVPFNITPPIENQVSDTNTPVTETPIATDTVLTDEVEQKE